MIGAALLDQLIGDPRRLLHPVVVMGWSIQQLRHWVEQWARNHPIKLRIGGGLISLIVVLGYGASFYFLTLSLKVIPVGIAYATWSGIGIVLITIISSFLYKQAPDWPAVIGMAMIIGGVIIIQLFSKTLHL